MESSGIKRTDLLTSDPRCYTSEIKDGIEICRLNICSEDDKKKFGIERGNYVTIYTKGIAGYTEFEIENIAKIVSEELTCLINLHSKKPKNRSNILIAGLGNREVTPDSLGACVVDKLNVTRHVKIIDKNMFDATNSCSLSSVCCGVFGKTGVETIELLRGLVSQIFPDVIIVIDALAAREYSRLGSVIQISDAGIVPGSGIGNWRDEISVKTLGVPIISIGVPTVVSAATFVCDSLEFSGYSTPDKKMRDRLEGLKNLFVTPKDCDMLVMASTRLIVQSIENSLL